MKNLLSSLILASFFITSVIGPLPAYAQDFRLPAPGVMVHLSPEFNPPILKGIKVHSDNPFRFDFILDKGDIELSNTQIKDESSKLIKYFLASLTIPEKDLWVNLSPYEKDRIIPDSFGLTEMGRDLLTEDYMLKQITASLIYPEGETGKKFWKRIYEEAAKKFGTTNIPVNTFNKVWIVPEKAVVYENGGVAFVLENHLKVMLEQDYLSLEKHADISPSLFKEGVRGSFKDSSALGSQIVREIVIPELTKEVNEGKNFAQLRQVFYSLILATWYKKKIKDSILNKAYSNRNKIGGVNVSAGDKDKIYQEYLKVFKKGVYNYIKEEPDQITGQTIPRKYFSGGVEAYRLNIQYKNPAQVSNKDFAQLNSVNLLDIGGDFKPIQKSADGAMTAQVSRSGEERSRIAWSEKRKNLFSITPEQMTIAYKLKGEPVKKLEEDGLKVVVGLPDDEQGLVILSESATPMEWIKKNGFQSPQEVTYEILFRPPEEVEPLTEEMVASQFVDVPDVAVEWSRAYDSQGPYYRLVLVASMDNVAPVVDWVQSNGYSVIQKTRISFGSSKILLGSDEQKSRKMTWEELINFMQALGVEEFQDMNPFYKNTIEEEQTDRKILEESLKDENFIKDVFENLFARPDLNLSKVSWLDIWYLGEGGFRRVYQVNLRIPSEPNDFSFVFKVLQEDVKYSDSGFMYNEKYVSAIESVLDQIRQKDLELYPPFIRHRIVKDSKGRERITIVEGLVPREGVPDDKVTRLVLEAYFKMYLILEGKIYLVDPKVDNTIPTKDHRGKEIATIIDLDNIYGPRMKADRRVYPEDYTEQIPSYEVDPFKDLLGRGYTAEEIIDVACDILGVEKAEELSSDYLERPDFILAATLRNFKAVQPRNAPPPKRETVKRPLPFTADPVDITINGLPRKVPATASLETILFDMHLSPEDDFIIKLNGRRIAGERTGWVHDDFKVPVANLLTAVPGKPGIKGIQIEFSSEHLDVEKLDFFHKSLEQQEFYKYLNILIKDLNNLKKVFNYATEQDQRLKAALNLLSTLINNQVTLRVDRGSVEHTGYYLLSAQQFNKLEISAKRIDFRNQGDRRQAMLECLGPVREGYKKLLDIYRKVSEETKSDHAMVTAKGGIDLNPAQMSMKVTKQGEDFKFDFNGTEIDAAQVTGATFTIRTMTPVTNLPQILGLNLEPADKPDQEILVKA